LLTGPLEPTKQWYALAKIAALKLAEAYRRQGENDRGQIGVKPCAACFDGHGAGRIAKPERGPARPLISKARRESRP